MKSGANGHSHLVLSYLSLRKSIGAIGTALPFVLALGGMLLFGTVLQSSVSAYYHTGMRDVFVGSLCAIAVFLLSYRGYDRRDRTAGILAAVFALGVALFPTEPDGADAAARTIGWLHVASAAGFFFTLAYFSLVLFRLSDKASPTPRKRQRNLVYEACGYIIIGSVVGIGAIKSLSFLAERAPACAVFWLEAAAIVAFGVSWATKGEAILADQSPAPAARVAPRIPPRSAAARDQAASV